MRTCPKCGREYTAPPALSRDDNKTEICPLCGLCEALDAAKLTDEQKAQIIETIGKDINNK